MRFNEWLEKLNNQQARLNELALSEVSETISVMGKTIAITLGKQKRHCEVDSSACDPRYLRPLYTNNKEEFDAMLESITEQTNQVVEATDVILTSVSEEAVPQAVIARMKGDKVGGDPADLVETMTEKKLKDLLAAVETCFDKSGVGVFRQFVANLAPMADKVLVVELGAALHIQWGRISINDRGIISTPDVEEAMYFLANYDLIKARVLDFFDQIKRIR
jgi:hypothetical protein